MKFVPVPGTDTRFCIWETRVRDYQAFVDATGRRWPKPSFAQELTHPAVHVSWEDAKAWCQWLTATERAQGLLPRHMEYRLPSDAEWSMAVGLTSESGATPSEKNMRFKKAYPWGTQRLPPPGVGNYGKSVGVDDFAHTSPVGSFAPNRFGLYDMGGNVWEWCDDEYHPGSDTRVMRGGSWFNVFGDLLLSSGRGNYAPAGRDENVGFRCVVGNMSR